jgi:hypothetical protein
MATDVIGAPTKEGNVELLEMLLNFPPSLVVTATTGVSVNVTAAGDLTGVAVGDVVTGLGIVTTPPTTVVALDNAGHTVTLSQAATGVHAATPLTFSPVPQPLPTSLHLFKDSLSPVPDTDEAAFIAAECDFSGYSAASLTYGTPGLDSNGNGVSYASRVEFQNSTGLVGNSVGGGWLSVQTVPGGSPVNVSVRFFKFIMPIPMSAALATLGAILVLNTPNLNGKLIIDN